MLISRFTKLVIIPRTLMNTPINYVHHDSTFTPKQFNVNMSPLEKKLLFNKKRRIIPALEMNYHDPIVLPGYDEHNIVHLLMELKQRKVTMSASNVCKLIHMLTKYDVMTIEAFDLIEKQAYRLKGEYKVRSIYGGLVGSIIYNRTGLIDFFLTEFQQCSDKFTLVEILDVMQAFVDSNAYSKESNKQIWDKHFRQDFLDGFFTFKSCATDNLCRIFDMMLAVGEEDGEVWKKLFDLMKHKHKWSRIPIIERLYSVSGTYPEAEKLFNAYFRKMAQDVHLTSRYNLTELRYHTPLEMIKTIEENPVDYHPKIRTLIPDGEDAAEWNAKYEQYLSVGAVKEEEQIIKDKSRSLGFAIRDRYENLAQDGMDFSKMSKEEFEEMFGDFGETMKTIETEDAKILEMQKKMEEEAARLAEKEHVEHEQKKGKGKKGKDGQKKEKKEKNKKEEQ